MYIKVIYESETVTETIFYHRQILMYLLEHIFVNVHRIMEILSWVIIVMDRQSKKHDLS